MSSPVTLLVAEIASLLAPTTIVTFELKFGGKSFVCLSRVNENEENAKAI